MAVCSCVWLCVGLHAEGAFTQRHKTYPHQVDWAWAPSEQTLHLTVIGLKLELKTPTLWRGPASWS